MAFGLLFSALHGVWGYVYPSNQPSLTERLAATANRPTGFDYLRVLLAIIIVCCHSVLMSYGREYADAFFAGPAGIIIRLVLPMFFALSGFLVAGSLERCKSLVSFFGLRMIRIFPALMVEVVLSALLLGVSFTSYDFYTYIHDRAFRAYFLNILGDIHFYLPGVFSDNPLPSIVNGQLWTVPFELKCYVAIGALSLVGIARRRLWLLGVTVLCQFGLLAHAMMKPYDAGRPNGASGVVLVMSFLAGVAIYACRDKLPWNLRMFGVAAVAALLCGMLPNGTYMMAFPAAYLTVYLGLTNYAKPRFMIFGDYSYGIFLYSFAIQQAFAAFGPATHHWYLNLLVCLPLSCLVAAFSWTFVEKPALKLKCFLPPLEQKWLTFKRGIFTVAGVSK